MEVKYIPTIGLEIHAELKTRTKMFCHSKNDPDEKEPNTNICPVCMGHPGTLPVINKEAVKNVLKVGMALNGHIAGFTEFDRKNYFYPDIPKGYQLSQYKYPLVTGGKLRNVEITRVHLEEDTATSKHFSNSVETSDLSTTPLSNGVEALESETSQGDLPQGDSKGFSLIDFNRAGVPLMELVTEPVIHSAEEASEFARELQLLLQYLGVAEANMEKGEMRVEANISVSQKSKATHTGGAGRPGEGQDPEHKNSLGTKVEVKNLNSFRSVERAIKFEVARHIGLLEKGEKVIQETRGWDEIKQRTFSQRTKEDSHDYRYFPDPDLPKLKISKIPEFHPEVLKKEIPELPWEKRERYKKDLSLKAEDVEMYVKSPKWARFLEEVIKGFKGDGKKIILASNYITSDLAGLAKKSGNESEIFGKISPENFAALIDMIAAGDISSRAAKDILSIMYKDGGDPKMIAESNDLLQKHDEGQLKTAIEKIIAENPGVVADYKGGKTSALQFFVGQVMKETKGSANPEKIREILLDLLKP